MCFRGSALLLLLLLSRFSRVRLCETLWTAARQAPLSMEFSRQESWSGLPLPSQGINKCPQLQAKYSTFSKDRVYSFHQVFRAILSTPHLGTINIGERNGNPLQCSCLENPRDRGAWWYAVHGVAQRRTRLKRLSSSSIEVKHL